MSTYKQILPWIILGFSALNVIFLGGKRRAFGIFVAQLRVEFNETTSLAELNWIGDSYAALGYLTTTISSTTILYFNRPFRIFQFIGACFILLACISSAYVPNPHWLFLTHTIFHGIGSSLILSVVGLIVNEHFDKNHKYHILATTLVSGGSVASIVFVEFYAYLIESYGWRDAFIILGVIYFVVNSSASIFFVKNKNKAKYIQNKCSINFGSSITRQMVPLLILWTLDRMLTSIVTYGMLLNLADYMRQQGLNLRKSALLTTLFAAGEASTYALGTVVTAVTKNLLKNRLRYVLLICTFTMATVLVIWEFMADNKHLCRLFAYLSGFCLGPSITFLFPAGEEMTTLPGHLAYPFSLAGMGMGMLLSPTLSALVAQAFEYKWFFLVQGCLIYFKSAVLLTSIILLTKIAKSSTDSIEGQDGDEELLLNDQEKLVTTPSPVLVSNGNYSRSGKLMTSSRGSVDSDEESVDLRER